MKKLEMTDFPWNQKQFTLMSKFVLPTKIKTVIFKKHNWSLINFKYWGVYQCYPECRDMKLDSVL